ncbi:MAG: phosphopantothenoylcysteine decarboxylase, partial [Kiritimatiellae bacterium]|nr:phosphopantothenoylcysteine decarboxylase [Kiritimatiellia bacterium]
MKFVVTAGPTREFIDPVRFLSNPSTGRMGFAVARAARAAGHEVTLIAGPVALTTPRGVRRIDVISARDMLAAVQAELNDTDALVMTAAVADWRPARRAVRKL